ncbi:MAG: hypothetical protein H0X24_00050 [Ktedonobacterales bacterium]|nr:hypothetical protein [Ktedonobacterales bacterium]
MMTHFLLHISRVSVLTLVLALGIGNTSALAATASNAAPQACPHYQAMPHGFTIPATLTCGSHSPPQFTPNGPVDCKGGHLVIYQDASYRGNYLCFGSGDYNLTDFQFCALWPFGCQSANDQLSSFQNNTASSGVFTTDINDHGRVLWFAPHAALAYVGDVLNDRISYLHLN